MIEKAYKMLLTDEGVRRFAYNDHDGKEVKLKPGKLTIGVGRNLEAKPLSDAVVKMLFEEDFQEALNGAKKLVKRMYAMTENQQLALINLVFNLGETKLKKEFPNTLLDLNNGDYKSAANRLRNSLWFKQVKGRAVRVLDMLENSAYPY